MEQWAKEVTGIQVVPDLGATPARVDHQTGVIQVSEKHMRILDADERKFVLLHEWAHLKGRTNSEEQADKMAFDAYVRLGGNLDDAISVLSKLLKNENPEHHWRMYLQAKRVKKYAKDHHIDLKKWTELSMQLSPTATAGSQALM